MFKYDVRLMNDPTFHELLLESSGSEMMERIL